MPELPEVEHARLCLVRWTKGRTIANVTVADPRVVHAGGAAKLPARLAGRRVTGVGRRGKWLEMTFDEGPHLYAHLGMTGKWVSRPADAPTERFEKVRVDLVKGKSRTSVRYIDPRVLGRMRLEDAGPPFWRKLGPDPLHDGLDPHAIGAKLAKRPKAIKEALMDQTLIAGVGNILATEALFRARLDPRTRADRLDARTVALVLRSVVAAIEHSLSLEEPGVEMTYVSESRDKNPFAVYGRGGKPCPRCKTTLTRIVQGGRATVFCATCQPPARASSLKAKGSRRRSS
jgi:formamidopyrimidine-DNA glycosylase